MGKKKKLMLLAAHVVRSMDMMIRAQQFSAVYPAAEKAKTYLLLSRQQCATERKKDEKMPRRQATMRRQNKPTVAVSNGLPFLNSFLI
jgi:hypothetical protein